MLKFQATYCILGNNEHAEDCANLRKHWMKLKLDQRCLQENHWFDLHNRGTSPSAQNITKLLYFHYIGQYRTTMDNKLYNTDHEEE